jgi:hypothetical protein
MAMTSKEIEGFPLWDQVSLGLRCARRCLPVLSMALDGMPIPGTGDDPYAEAVQCIQELVLGTSSDAQTRAAILLPAMDKLKTAITPLADAYVLLNYHATVSFTLDAALAITLNRPKDAMRSVRWALESFCKADTHSEANEANATMVQFDIDLLSERMKHHELSDRSPVSQDSFGPLWLTRPPYSFPMQGDSGDEELTIRLELPPSATDSEVLAKIKEMVSLADDLHRAYGGNGLKVAGLEAFGEVACPVEAK